MEAAALPSHGDSPTGPTGCLLLFAGGGNLETLSLLMGLPGGSGVESPPATWETQELQVQTVRQEDSLEKEMTTCSSILAW